MDKVETGSITFDVAAREAQVIGSGPKIEAIPNDDIDAEAWDLVNRIRASTGAGKADVMPEYMRLILKNRPIFERQMEMGTTIFLGALPKRERELAVLRCGWLCRAPYEWGEHVNIGKRVGLTPEEIERTTRGSSAEGWTEHEAAILRGVEEMIGDQAIGDKTWATLAKTWDEAQMLEFPMMVGQYVATAFIQNSVRMTLAEGNAGLSAR